MSNHTDWALPQVSIIIPALNEASRLPSSLKQIARYLADAGMSAEIIVVDNGSTDRTSDLVREFSDQNSNVLVTLLSEPRRGKGAAVRAGMLQARGQILFLCDADLSMPIEGLARFVTELDSGVDIVIGCREGAGACRRGEPLLRKLMSRYFNKLVQFIAGTGLPDTQCGFKAFRRNVARDLFATQTICGWGFDVEILMLARQRGYSLSSIPIVWNHDSDSRVRPLRDAIAMLCEVWKIHDRMQVSLNGGMRRAKTTIAGSIGPGTLTSPERLKKKAG